MYHPTLLTDAQNQIQHLKYADLVIGLPSYKNAMSAAHVAQIALEGAQTYFPQLKTVLINADAGLEATTRQAVLTQAATNDPSRQVVTGRYNGVLGQGSATAAILDAALALDAKAIIILDSNTQTITPSWIPALAHLVLLNKADLVMPRYQWLLPNGALSDLLVYPLFRTMWGMNVRHPCAPDFGLSPALATSLLDADIWETQAAASALPTWLVTHGVLNGWRVVQTAVGEKGGATEAELVRQTTPHCNGTSHLAQTNAPVRLLDQQLTRQILATQDWFYSTASVMFSLARQYRRRWSTVRTINSLSTLTEFAATSNHISTPNLDTTTLLDNLALKWIEYRHLWQYILTPSNLSQLESIAARPVDDFYFPTNLWTRIVYDFVVVFNRGECDPQQLVQSLFPIYQGRLAAYWQEIAGLSAIGREGTASAQAVEFEELRNYLKLRWHTYQLYD